MTQSLKNESKPVEVSSKGGDIISTDKQYHHRKKFVLSTFFLSFCFCLLLVIESNLQLISDVC